MKIKFKKLHGDAVLPTKAREGDAGLDLTCIDNGTLLPGDHKISYSLGLAMEIPEGHVGLLFPRSSVVKKSLALSNCVGVIDSGYRGEVTAVFSFTDNTQVKYYKGDRIAQLVVLPIPETEAEWTEELSDSERGAGGFGSTGN